MGKDVEVDTLSEWIKSIANVLKRRFRRIKHSVNTIHESIFSDTYVVRELSRLHETFVIVPADKASNNYTFVCKRHYVSILSEELGLNSLPGNPTYNLTDFSASEVLDNHKSVLTSFGIETNDDELDFCQYQTRANFSDPDVVTERSRLHENFVVVPADKASNNYTFACKRYYVDILIEELGLHLLHGNPTYNLTDFSASEVLDNHNSVLTSFGIQTTDEELDLPYIYLIPKVHNNPYNTD